MWRLLVTVLTVLSLNVALIVATTHGSVASGLPGAAQSSGELASEKLKALQIAMPFVGENDLGTIDTDCVPVCFVHVAIEPSIWQEDPVYSARELRLLPADLILYGITPSSQKRPPKSAVA